MVTTITFPQLSNHAIELLEKRYTQPGETATDLFYRVAQAVAQAEANYTDCVGDVPRYNKLFYEMMANLDFLPNSPTLMNAGLDKGQLSACFVLPVEDSISGIYQSVKEAAIVTQAAGGVGLSFSRLRPKGDRVKVSTGIASGPCSFIQSFDAMAESVKQGGRRRGAFMGCLRVDHPDILEFINLKAEEGKLPNFNLSVAITDAFMEALANDTEYSLITPHTGVQVGTLPARKVWDILVKQAWSNGEPGILFIDTMNEGNPVPELGPIETSNPCQPGNALVLTPDGIRTFDDIDVGSAIWSGKQWTTVVRKLNTGTKPVYRYRTTYGEFVGTEDHMVLDRGQRVRAGDAQRIDIAVAYPDYPESALDPQDIMDGLMIGDGSVHRASNNLAYLIVGKRDTDYFTSEVGPLLLKHRPGIKNGSWEVQTTITAQELPRVFERAVPDRFFYGDCRKVLGFLRGLFSANGSVVGARGSSRVTLKQSSKQLIQQVQIMLSSVGIRSYITTNKPAIFQHKNGSYCSRESYDLNIATDRYDFLRLIGFLQQYKNHKIVGGTTNHNAYSSPVVAREYIGDLPVYDITVSDEDHTYWTAGQLVSNCGEVPLPPYGSCVLGSINLAHMVKDSDVDWSKIRDTVRLAVRFLDNIIDINWYPLPQIKERAFNDRRIGLGVMGWADMLIHLDIAYSSQEALDLASEVARSIHHEAVATSADLAKERGYYQGYQPGMPKRRNATLMTVAPTGSTSTIAGCSSGIEPVFALHYTRKTFDGMEIEETNPYLIEWLRSNQDPDGYEIHLNNVRKSGKLGSVMTLLSHEVFLTAGEIDPRQHVAMQAAWQKSVDSAISKTINMPNSATIQDVDEALRLAFVMGCKGVTVYRDGSRDGQVLTTNATKPAVNVLVPRERPIVTSGTTEKIRTTCGNLYVTINEDQQGICEVFLMFGKAGGCSNAHLNAIAMLASQALRAGVTVEAIVKSLKGIRCPSPTMGGACSCPDALARVLEARLSEPIEMTGMLVGMCPDCGQPLINESGCAHCSCGYERCS